MKEILIKDSNRNMLLVLYSSEYITELTNHEISEINIKFEERTRQLWNDMKTRSFIERTTSFSQSIKKNDNKPRNCIFGF